MTTPGKIPTLSTREGLSYSLSQMLPNYLGGLFTPNRTGAGFWSKLHPDPAAVRLVSRLRKKYQSDYLYLSMLGKKSLLVLDPEGIRQILDHSPELFAEPKIKRKGMSHFQPNALTISRGADWRERRSFNEAVLESGQRVHSYGEPFSALIRQETAAALQASGSTLVWEDVARLFQRITLQIIFGAGFTDLSLSHELQQMMSESNRGFALKKSRYFDDFYARLRTQLKKARADSLAFACSQAPTTENTRVANQVPHWMFAMADTLAINTVRALAAIVAHPAAETQVRQEMAQVELSSATAIDQLNYLEGCLQEAMRLWPTTPLLVRETVIDTELGGETIPAKTQVIINNSFNHRDRETHPFADSFSPEIWRDSRVNYHFNHLSNGTQGCAGKDLALFVGKAVLANLLNKQRYQLLGPALEAGQPLPYRYNHFQLEFKHHAA